MPASSSAPCSSRLVLSTLYRLHKASRLLRWPGCSERADAGDTTRFTRQARELRIEKAHVERCVVDDEFRAIDEGDQLGGDLRELRRGVQARQLDAVHRKGPGVDVAFRIQVAVKFLSRE